MTILILPQWSWTGVYSSPRCQHQHWCWHWHRHQHQCSQLWPSFALKFFVEAYCSALTALSFIKCGVHILIYLKSHNLGPFEQDANVMHEWFWVKNCFFLLKVLDLGNRSPYLIGFIIMDAIRLMRELGRGYLSRCIQHLKWNFMHEWFLEWKYVFWNIGIT